MPKRPTLTDLEIRNALEAHHERQGRWPTIKEARDGLPGPAGNERLSRILGELRQPVEPAMSSPHADLSRTIRERLARSILDEVERIGWPRMVALDTLLPEIAAAVEKTRQHCLASDLASHRDAQNRMRAAAERKRDILAAVRDLARVLEDDREAGLEPVDACPPCP